VLRRFVLTAVAVTTSIGAAGCAGSSGSDATSEDEVTVVARCERDFNAPLQAKMAKVKERLERSPARYAAEVLLAFDERRVTALPFCAMTAKHFEHFQKDVDLSSFGSTPEEQFRRLRAGETQGMRSVHAQLFGYMWEETIYIASNMGQEVTLETVAHEARHVFRRAHERNFDDQRVTCVEELEAARAEVQVHKDEISPEQDRALLDRVHELYELDKLDPDHCGFRR
jgi:hypothetical protein